MGAGAVGGQGRVGQVRQRRGRMNDSGYIRWRRRREGGGGRMGRRGFRAGVALILIGLCVTLASPVVIDGLGLPPAPPPPAGTITLASPVVIDGLGLPPAPPPPAWTVTLEPSVVIGVLGLSSMWAIPLGIAGLSMVFLGVAAALTQRRRKPSARGRRGRTKAPRQSSTRRGATARTAAEKPRRGSAGTSAKRDGDGPTRNRDYVHERLPRIAHPDLYGDRAPRPPTRKGITASTITDRAKASAGTADGQARDAATAAAARDRVETKRKRAKAPAKEAGRQAGHESGRVDYFPCWNKSETDPLSSRLGISAQMNTRYWDRHGGVESNACTGRGSVRNSRRPPVLHGEGEIGIERPAGGGGGPDKPAVKRDATKG